MIRASQVLLTGASMWVGCAHHHDQKTDDSDANESVDAGDRSDRDDASHSGRSDASSDGASIGDATATSDAGTGGQIAVTTARPLLLKDVSCAILVDGSVTCSGFSPEPAFATAGPFVELDSYLGVLCGLSDDGMVSCTSTACTNIHKPTDKCDVAISSKAIFVLDTAGAVETFACSGTPDSSLTFPGKDGYVDIAARDDHVCALHRDGYIDCLGAARLTGKYKALAIGPAQLCALEQDGTPHCWRSNGANASASLPETVPPAGLIFVELAAGSGMSCGRASSGAVQCWGQQVPATRSGSFTSIATEGMRVCGVSATGDSSCWTNGGDDSLFPGQTLRVN